MAQVKTKDVFIKDEGDFVTVGFQTEKAKEIVRKENIDNIYGDQVLKLDVVMESQPAIITWLISHGLSWEEF